MRIQWFLYKLTNTFPVCFHIIYAYDIYVCVYMHIQSYIMIVKQSCMG